MLTKLRSILEMIRFSHTLFAMPFALLAAIMAWKVKLPEGVDPSLNDFRWSELGAVILCMVTARSAAMASVFPLAKLTRRPCAVKKWAATSAMRAIRSTSSLAED